MRLRRRPVRPEWKPFYAARAGGSRAGPGFSRMSRRSAWRGMRESLERMKEE